MWKSSIFCSMQQISIKKIPIFNLWKEQIQNILGELVLHSTSRRSDKLWTKSHASWMMSLIEHRLQVFSFLTISISLVSNLASNKNFTRFFQCKSSLSACLRKIAVLLTVFSCVWAEYPEWGSQHLFGVNLVVAKDRPLRTTINQLHSDVYFLLSSRRSFLNYHLDNQICTSIIRFDYDLNVKDSPCSSKCSVFRFQYFEKRFFQSS